MVDLIKTFFGAMWIVFKSIIDLIPTYLEISGFREQLLACLLGVPVCVISFALAGKFILRLVKKNG